MLIPALPAAPEQWIKLETPHFELYTTAGEKKGREAILYFEQVRSFFHQASASKREGAPVRIVAFRSEGQYKPYRMNEAALAYYTQSRNREFIVMQDTATEHYPAAIHEYTHLVIGRDGLKIPVWLNEGWAELYSSLKPQGNKALVGSLLPGRVQALFNSKWLPLPLLAAVDQNSSLYNERDKAGIFYAQSWILVHMLYLSAGYRDNFTKFVIALSNGQNTEQAFQSVYGKSLQAVESDLNRYIRSDRLNGALFDVKLEKSAEDPQISEVPALESGLILADLLALVHKPEEARRAYAELAKDNPENAEVLESSGYLELRTGDLASARQYFSRAYKAGSKSAQMCFDYAALESSGDAGAKAAIPILQRAVELKPDYVEARFQLGMALASQQNYQDAQLHLRQIKTVNPDQAPLYFLALAYAEFGTSQPDAARKDAEAAKKWAKTPGQTDQADSLLRAIEASQAPVKAAAVPNAPPPNPGDSATPQKALSQAPPTAPLQAPTAAPPPALSPAQDVRRTAPRNPFVQPGDQIGHVEGVAQRLECDGRAARFHVLVGRTTLVLEIPDPEKVLIKHSGEAHHDFTCGVQKPFPVAVEYAVKPDPKKGTAGIVRELEF